MSTRPRSLLGFSSFALCAALGLVSCAIPLGPGYTIRKQTVDIHFRPSSEAPVSVAAHYLLVNTGNQPLPGVEIILPDETLYAAGEVSIEWDGAPLTADVRSDPLGRIGQLTFASPWAVHARHSLRILYSISQPGPGAGQRGFASDAFFLPAEGWSPVLRPAPGLFGSGGSAPKRWRLVVRVPQDFLVHSSGKIEKTGIHDTEKLPRFLQRPGDNYPFVVAGHYAEAIVNVERHTIYFWTRSPRDPALLRSAADSLARTLDAYDAMFGSRSKDARTVWIVECPVRSACGESPAPEAALPPAPERARIIADVAFLDAEVLNASPSADSIAVAAAPLLAPSWLGYGRNPGFWEQELPMSGLPSFAAELGREATEGPAVRTETIRRVLAAIATASPAQPRGNEGLTREKSFLFFFALEDQFGRDHLHAALRNMVQARRGRGYDLEDLIAALEAEAGKPVAPFVRLWLKHPGVPEEFRARYAAPAAPTNAVPKENPQ